MSDTEREELRRAAEKVTWWQKMSFEDNTSALLAPAVTLAAGCLSLLSRLEALEAERQEWHANVAGLIRQEADKYQTLDGEPGPLGFNCWGWRDIARALRSAADKVSPRRKPPEV